MTSFILNNELIHTPLAEGCSLLDFVRYTKLLKGTKIGCREGDCGACTVLIGDIENNKLEYKSMTSCLMPLGNAHGKHVLTVEGINMQQLSPVQQLLIDNNGTQCGFCTVGFVMSLIGFTLSEEDCTQAKAIKAIDGNICRCTGYKSIERSTDALCDLLEIAPSEHRLSWLVEKGFIPAYLSDIQQRLVTLQEENKSLGPIIVGDLDLLIGGGTDVMVQKPISVRKSSNRLLLDDHQLKGIRIVNKICCIGASTTVTEFVDSDVIRMIFPDVEKYAKLVSSTPIRNMATLGGNLINASPIGDMTIFFLALDSSIVLNNGTSKRSVKLKEFYLEYKTMNKAADEYVESIQFPIPSAPFHYNFEKVSKRTHLDIASVNSACLLKISNGIISEAHISAGGVAPVPKYLAKASAYLLNMKVEELSVDALLQIVDAEVSPISDARGTVRYKRLLLRQLVLSHLIQIEDLVQPVTETLHV